MNIADFLPRYPSLRASVSAADDVDDDVLRPYVTAFKDVIVSKKEFQDLELAPVEAIPERGEAFNHQKIIARFLSGNTPYDRLLLAHAPGTGKTCSAVAAIELIRATNKKIKRAVVLARGTGLIKNFTQELLFKCTAGQYIPKDYDTLTRLQRAHRVKKKTSEYYEFETFERFARKLEKLSDQKIHTLYDDTIFVVDEIHNIRRKDGSVDAPVVVYNQLWRLFHLVDGAKVMLMTGTPIKDTVGEIVDIFNLLLPADDQFNADGFENEYFSDGRMRLDKVDEFKRRIEGYVSYLKSMTSDVKRVFVGRRLGGLTKFLVYPAVASAFQSRGYARAYEADKTDNTIFNNSRQASLFVFPDGSWGTKGSEKYVEKRTRVNRLGKPTSEYVMTRDLAAELKTLDDLAKYSAKYHALLTDTLPKSKKTFVYSELVDGSGAILLGLILNNFGYTKATGKETTPGKRYVIATTKTSGQNEIRTLINAFNSPANVDGSRISVIVGSKTISEGYTLKNVTAEVIMTPFWNYADVDQALARGWRVGSHVGSPDGTDLKIYQMAIVGDGPSTDVGGASSIDVEMYRVSEAKDVVIKDVEYALKTVAFDCALTKNRNVVRGAVDGSRECDYKRCDYVCDGNFLPTTDNLTYNAFYSSSASTIKRLEREFRTSFSVNIVDWIDGVLRDGRDGAAAPSPTAYELVKAINEAIEKNVTFKDRYGFDRYLKISNGQMFLTSDVTNTVDVFGASLEPTVDGSLSFKDALAKITDDANPMTVSQLFRYPQYATGIIPTLSERVKTILLQGAVEAEARGTRVNADARRAILDFFRGQWKREGDTWYVNAGTSTCLRPGATDWQECDPLGTAELKKRLSTSPVGFYGMINPQLGNVFCIREVQDDAAVKDLRRVRVGKRCADYDRMTLVDVIARRIKRPQPADFAVDATRDEIIQELMSLRVYKPDADDVSDVTQLRRVLFWARQLRAVVCDNIRDWMEVNNLVEESIDCGQQKKVRKRALAV